MKKEVVLKEVKEIISRRLGEEVKIYLFGSWVKGNATETSDLDIGILGEKEIDFSILVRIKNEIAAIPTLRKIDIIDLNNTDESFKNNVLNHAQLL